MAKKIKTIGGTLVSMTFSIENEQRELLRKYATAIGATRRINNGQSMTGDLSKAIKMLIAYGLSHIKEVEEWRTEEVRKTMSVK